MTCSGNNVHLLFLSKVNELNSITRYTDCEVSVLFLLRMLHSVNEFFCTEYIYIEVVCALIKVAVHNIYEVVNTLVIVVSESTRVNCLSI